MPIGVKFLAEATLDKRGAYRKSQKATWVGKLIGYVAYFIQSKSKPPKCFLTEKRVKCEYDKFI